MQASQGTRVPKIALFESQMAVPAPCIAQEHLLDSQTTPKCETLYDLHKTATFFQHKQQQQQHPSHHTQYQQIQQLPHQNQPVLASPTTTNNPNPATNANASNENHTEVLQPSTTFPTTHTKLKTTATTQGVTTQQHRPFFFSQAQEKKNSSRSYTKSSANLLTEPQLCISSTSTSQQQLAATSSTSRKKPVFAFSLNPTSTTSSATSSLYDLMSSKLAALDENPSDDVEFWSKVKHIISDSSSCSEQPYTSANSAGQLLGGVGMPYQIKIRQSQGSLAVSTTTTSRVTHLPAIQTSKASTGSSTPIAFPIVFDSDQPSSSSCSTRDSRRPMDSPIENTKLPSFRIDSIPSSPWNSASAAAAAAAVPEAQSNLLNQQQQLFQQSKLQSRQLQLSRASDTIWSPTSSCDYQQFSDIASAFGTVAINEENAIDMILEQQEQQQQQDNQSNRQNTTGEKEKKKIKIVSSRENSHHRVKKPLTSASQSQMGISQSLKNLYTEADQYSQQKQYLMKASVVNFVQRQRSPQEASTTQSVHSNPVQYSEQGSGYLRVPMKMSAGFDSASTSSMSSRSCNAHSLQPLQQQLQLNNNSSSSSSSLLDQMHSLSKKQLIPTGGGNRVFSNSLQKTKREMNPMIQSQQFMTNSQNPQLQLQWFEKATSKQQQQQILQQQVQSQSQHSQQHLSVLQNGKRIGTNHFSISNVPSNKFQIGNLGEKFAATFSKNRLNVNFEMKDCRSSVDGLIHIKEYGKEKLNLYSQQQQMQQIESNQNEQENEDATTSTLRNDFSFCEERQPASHHQRSVASLSSSTSAAQGLFSQQATSIQKINLRSKQQDNLVKKLFKIDEN